MTKKPIELSRRKILAGMGAAGVASVGAGLGTSAYFSDNESFEGNTLTAGSLDMKVDWEEHYNYPQLYGLGNPTDGLDVTMDPDNPENYTAFPPGVEANDDQDPLLYVHNDDVSTYMDNTSIEAFPDEEDNDGIQDEFDEENACDVLADVGGDSGGLSSDSRTENAATEPGDPLVQLQDVKPGDFGEVTLSFHLCNNPGYVWLNADNVEASENGLTEPEIDADDEDQIINNSTGDIEPEDGEVELLDAIQTAWWYDDNCNNLTDGGTTSGGEADVVIVADGSGSVTGDAPKFQALQDGAEALVNSVGSNVNVGLVVFSNSASEVASLTDSKSDTNTAIQNDANYPGGGTDVGAGIDAGQSHLTGSAGRSGADKYLVVLTNGNSSTGRSDAQAAKDAGTDIYGIAYGGGADEDLIEDISSQPKNDNGAIGDDDEFAFVGDQTDIGDVFSDIGGEISSAEEIFFQGDLATALDALSADNGIPLDGDGGDDFDEFNDDPTAESRGCFEPTPETNCIGFSWWVPTSIENEIQSDRVSFDLGFYAEQCRHNDGAGSAAD